jgi:formylglycine-generating enzyme required for sulfatase activity
MNAQHRFILPLFLVLALVFFPACSDDDDGDDPAASEFVLIPAGSFTMGDAKGVYETNERPARTVTINAFYMSKYELSQALYQQVMGENPSHTKGDKRPVEMVSWPDALKFCNALSTRDGYTPVYSDIDGSVKADFNANGYRLPTEAEWEYACRAGTTTPYYTGNGVSDLERCAWFSINANGTTQDRGQLEVNNFGLYDMHGNVFEWCWDWYRADYYQQGVNNNPRGPDSGQQKVCRGGSFFVFEYGCRAGFRSMLEPAFPGKDIGIRLARNAD